MITVGQLDTIIQIQYQEFDTNADYGGIQSGDWEIAEDSDAAIVEHLWAHLVYRGGKESEEGEQVVGEQKVQFYIRYETFKDRVKPGWRIRYTDATSSYLYYYIENIKQIDGRHKMTCLTAVQKDNN